MAEKKNTNICWENEKDNLDRMINQEHKSYIEIGKLYGVSYTYIKKIARKLNINLPSRRKINPSETFNKGKKFKNRKNSISQFQKDENKKNRHNKLIDTKYKNLGIPHIGHGCCPICGEYHCTKQFCKNHNFLQLIGFVKHLGFDATTIGTTKVFGEFQRIHDLIYDLYWNQNLSLIEIGKKFNYKEICIPINILDSLGIPRRDFSESQKIAILENRKIPSNSSITSLNINQTWYTTWDNKKIFLRSSYELDYAKELDRSQITYEVESIKIKYYDSTLQTDRIAIPDFYLPNTNEIVEIKSDFTLDIQEMLDKFDAYKKLGYNVKLILEHEEIDLYNIENLISESRLFKIKNKNIKQQISKNKKDRN